MDDDEQIEKENDLQKDADDFEDGHEWSGKIRNPNVEIRNKSERTESLETAGESGRAGRGFPVF